MKRRSLLSIMVSCICLISMMTMEPLIANAQQKDKVFRWKAQFCWFKGDTTRDFGWVPTLKQIQEKSKGRLVIDLYEPKQLVPVEGMLDAVKNRAIDLAMTAGSAYSTIQDLGIIDSALPMAWSTPEDAYNIFYKRGLLELLRDAYAKNYNVYYPGPTGGAGAYGISTSFPIISLNDLKGKKIRASGSMSSMIEALGALPVYVPGADLYMSLKMGIVQGMAYEFAMFVTGKYGEVVNHVIMPPIKCPPTAVYWVNLNSWKALPKDLQELIEKQIQDDFISSTHNGMKRDAESIKEANMKVVQLSDEEIKRIRQLSFATWEQIAKKGPLAQKAVQIIKDYYGM